MASSASDHLQPNGRTAPVRQMRQPRLAELVAGQLRDEILSGRLQEGDTLPRQEDLINDFNVSLPAVREALRILENEGLVSVRRGNVGGAVVHLPRAERVAYMVGLVLQSRQATLADVGQALQMLEPVCAVMCAERPDRHEELVPKLREIVANQAELFGDASAYNREARRFHAEMVSQCGNDTIVLVVGALEAVWSVHEQRIYEHADVAQPSMVSWRAAQREHERIVDAIDAGNTSLVGQITRKHLAASHAFSVVAGEDRGLSASLLI